jgi:hypothetical protein
MILFCCCLTIQLIRIKERCKKELQLYGVTLTDIHVSFLCNPIYINATFPGEFREY